MPARLFALNVLQDIPQPQIRVVATATLRLAVNAGNLSRKRRLSWLSGAGYRGEEEARLLIYQGSLIPPAAQIGDWWWLSAAPALSWLPALARKPRRCLACRWAA